MVQQPAGLLPHGIQELLAGLLADPAVLVHPGMPLALIAAAPADGYAGLQQRPRDVGVVLGLAARYRCGGRADIGAVQAQPDALDHFGQVLRTLRSGGVKGSNEALNALARIINGELLNEGTILP